MKIRTGIGKSCGGRALMPLLLASQAVAGNQRPNILLISIDDLNPEVGFLGDPFAVTPHMDRLAAESVVFENAHIQAPICGPSRNSLLIGKYPHRTGLYSLDPMFRDVEELAHLVALPQLFREQGYLSWAAGKIYHTMPDPKSFDRFTGWFGGFGPFPEEPINLDPEMPVHPYYDWGPFLEDEETADYKIATTVAGFIHEAAESRRPFFISAGFLRPHCPVYAPQRWFDLHPIEGIEPVNDQAEFLDQVPPYALKLVHYNGRQHYNRWMKETDERSASFIQAYRAAVSFVDHCVGIVMDALRESGQDENTLVVLFSDHGVHNGRKNLWYKRTLWEESTRVPLLIRAPGIPHRRTGAPVGLIDLYPTLCELTGMEPPQELDGLSLVELMKNRPGAENRPPALTSHGPGNFALRDRHFRYIRYADGSEELYDHRTDPDELRNLASLAEYAGVIERFQPFVPQTPVPFVQGSRDMGSPAFPGK